MPLELAPGRPENLTPDQEKKLKELWQLLFKLGNIKVPGKDDATATGAEGETTPPLTPTATNETPSPAAGDKDGKKKKSRLGFLRRSKDKDSGSSSSGASTTGSTTSDGSGSFNSIADTLVDSSDAAANDKYGQNKEFKKMLESTTPETLHTTFWTTVKHDHPDALILRFLRARKWDVPAALVMMVSTLHWREREVHLDDDIMLRGEEGCLRTAKGEALNDGGKAINKKDAEDFMTICRVGKSLLHGVDDHDRPLCVVRVRLHKAGDQTEAAMERYTVYTIETARMLLRSPVDTATILFDMTDFSLANMDYAPVKFMIKCFEAHYPESLGALLVHKAPWVFQGIWKIIRGWLDPVVASKVHFTSNTQELEAFISKSRIITELKGSEDWSYQYVEPVAGENSVMSDTATRDTIQKERDAIASQFETATIEWITTPSGPESATKNAVRHQLAAKLAENYWRLDPYIRGRSWLDRTGVLGQGGKVSIYPGTNHPTGPHPVSTAASGGAGGAGGAGHAAGDDSPADDDAASFETAPDEDDHTPAAPHPTTTTALGHEEKPPVSAAAPVDLAHRPAVIPSADDVD